MVPVTDECASCRLAELADYQSSYSYQVTKESVWKGSLLTAYQSGFFLDWDCPPLRLQTTALWGRHYSCTGLKRWLSPPFSKSTPAFPHQCGIWLHQVKKLCRFASLVFQYLDAWSDNEKKAWEYRCLWWFVLMKGKQCHQYLRQQSRQDVEPQFEKLKYQWSHKEPTSSE